MEDKPPQVTDDKLDASFASPGIDSFIEPTPVKGVVTENKKASAISLNDVASS